MRKYAAIVTLALSMTPAGCAPGATQRALMQGTVPFVAAPTDLGAHKHIKHVVVVIQENRSFENFFAGYPGADAPMYGCEAPQDRQAASAQGGSAPDTGCPAGDRTVALHQDTFANAPNLGHSFESAIIDWHKGKMDGFGPFNTNAYAYTERSQLAPYWSMARQYVLADHMFPTEFGPSWTAHLTLVAGTDNLNPELALADFADGESNCKAPPGRKTTTVDENRVVRHDSGPYPCLDQFKTMAQLLDAAGITWRYYAAAQLKAFIWSPFASMKYVYHGPDWTEKIVVPQTQILRDIAQGKLASVSWVTPNKHDSDHPAARSDTGPSWVTAVVNAIGASRYWSSTVIVILWDDWGGFYDNVSPPQLDFRGLGVRVPCLIVSPYAKEGAVIHTQYEYGSILRFIRDVFVLPPLGPTADGYTDTRANNMFDSFDFAQPPRPFKKIASKYPEAYFLHEVSSGEPIDDE